MNLEELIKSGESYKLSDEKYEELVERIKERNRWFKKIEESERLDSSFLNRRYGDGVNE